VNVSASNISGAGTVDFDDITLEAVAIEGMEQGGE
jgi:hypothetical protein